MKVKLVPKKVFFTKGKGVHEDALTSFELALRDAGIEKFNLVPVSSIIPPKCEIISIQEGLEKLEDGEIVFCVMSRKTSNDEEKTIYASIGAALPVNEFHGYLTEYSGILFDKSFDPGRYAEERAREMFKTTHAREPEKTLSLTCYSRVEKYTTVISAAVFII